MRVERLLAMFTAPEGISSATLHQAAPIAGYGGVYLLSVDVVSNG